MALRAGVPTKLTKWAFRMHVNMILSQSSVDAAAEVDLGGRCVELCSVLQCVLRLLTNVVNVHACMKRKWKIVAPNRH
jgi:hypothetical protein